MSELTETLASLAVSSTDAENKPILMLANGASFRVKDVSRPDWLDGLLFCKTVAGGDLYLDPAAIIAIHEDEEAIGGD